MPRDRTTPGLFGEPADPADGREQPMNVLDQVVDFFSRLVRGRVDSVRIGAKSKLSSVEARAKAKVAGTVNRAIDSRVDQAKATAKAKIDERRSKG
jgi:hypothetical protein